MQPPVGCFVAEHSCANWMRKHNSQRSGNERVLADDGFSGGSHGARRRKPAHIEHILIIAVRAASVASGDLGANRARANGSTGIPVDVVAVKGEPQRVANHQASPIRRHRPGRVVPSRSGRFAKR
eukprot:911543-Prymnesium_polylepis.1